MSDKVSKEAANCFYFFFKLFSAHLRDRNQEHQTEPERQISLNNKKNILGQNKNRNKQKWGGGRM